MDNQYFLCRRCELVYAREAWIVKNWHCPTQGCGGGPMDPWNWSRFVQSYDYPEHPEPGSAWSPIGTGRTDAGQCR